MEVSAMVEIEQKPNWNYMINKLKNEMGNDVHKIEVLYKPRWERYVVDTSHNRVKNYYQKIQELSLELHKLEKTPSYNSRFFKPPPKDYNFSFSLISDILDGFELVKLDAEWDSIIPILVEFLPVFTINLDEIYCLHEVNLDEILGMSIIVHNQELIHCPIKAYRIGHCIREYAFEMFDQAHASLFQSPLQNLVLFHAYRIEEDYEGNNVVGSETIAYQKDGGIVVIIRDFSRKSSDRFHAWKFPYSMFLRILVQQRSDPKYISSIIFKMQEYGRFNIFDMLPWGFDREKFGLYFEGTKVGFVRRKRWNERAILHV